ncbi:hypothetical protein AHF37_03271 [Paragonimus kellicotti]|nr:hypothetical protein AHF37_03271 [Paragonimus kellicotti]
MGDLDLYSELIEEDDRKESAPKPPESLLEYMYLLESKCAELETEVETLNAHLARCEHERFQLITVNEQLQDNFARMGLACRREMVKLKCRVQWLCARANVRAAKYIDEPQNSQIPLTKLNPENALSYSDIISFLHSLKVPEGGLQPQTPMKSLQSNSNASFHPNGTVPVSVSQHSDAQPGTGPTFSHTSRRISTGSTVDSHSSPSRSSSSSSSTSSSSSSSSETAGSRNARTVTAPPSPSQVHRGIKCSSKSRSHIDPGRVKHPDSRPHNSINCKQRCRTEDDKRKQQPSSSSHSPRRRRSPSPSKSSRTTSWFDRSRKTHSNRSPSKTRSTWSTRQTASSSIGNDRIQVRQSNGFVRYGHDRSPQNTNSYKLTRDKSKSATQSSIVKVHTDAKPPTVTKRKASKTPRQSEEHPIWSSTESRQATPLDLSHNELHANKFVEAGEFCTLPCD